MRYMNAENPYASPKNATDATASHAMQLDRASPTILRTILWSILLSIVAGILLLVGGFFLGEWIFGLNPAYWFDAIYGRDFDEYPGMIEKVRIQTGIRFGLNLGAVGFWSGLIAPWLRFVYIRRGQRYRKRPAVRKTK